MESPDVADFADITVPTGLTVPSAPTGLAVPSAPMALKVFVRKIGEKKSVVAIVAPEGAAPERTMESLLATLLAYRDESWARVTLSMLVVIAARNTGNGVRYHMVHESFPVNAYEAESRRLARFMTHGHTPGVVEVPPPVRLEEIPFTLDLRCV